MFLSILWNIIAPYSNVFQKNANHRSPVAFHDEHDLGAVLVLLDCWIDLTECWGALHMPPTIIEHTLKLVSEELLN
jgi:hypothetical protein